MTTLDAEYDNSKMASYIDQFIAEGVDGILVWPMEVAPTGPPVDRALAAGIPVVTSDRMSGSDKVNARVTGGLPSNGAQMGMFLANQMDKEQKYDYKIVMLRKPLGASSEALRTGYMLKVMSYFPGVEILQSYHDTDNREEAFANAQAALQAYPDIDVFYSTGDHEALAAIEATTQANRLNSREGDKKIIFVTPDDSKEAMSYIDKGILDMDVPLTPLQADIALRTLLKIVTGDEAPYNVMVPNIPMVTADGEPIFGFETQKTGDWYEYTFGPPID
jgi:ribose transport system substrate-binding protein